MDYISAPQAALKLRILEPRMQKLCKENHIPDVAHFSHMWLIPEDVKKPKDGRFKDNKSKPSIVWRKGREQMKKVLVVEDDTLFNRTLSYSLESMGYDVASAFTAASARRFFNQQEYHLYVLDINLPDGSGFDLCREIKERYETAVVIFLTANDMESDMIRGFELGADDYVTKPFPISVFQKKVAALFNRITQQDGRDIFDDSNLHIDFSQMTAALAGQAISFTPMEYRLLKMLTNNPQIVLTRQVLLEKLWDIDDNFVDEHALTSAISRVRIKIEIEDFQYIKTVYGMGYLWIGGLKR